MARARLQLAAHMGPEELKERARAHKRDDPKEARRWLGLWHISKGKSLKEAALACGLSPGWLSRLARRYSKGGPEAMADGHAKHPGGARPLLDGAEQKELLLALKKPVPVELGGGLWSGRKVALWIRKRTGRETYPQQGWSYLQRLGLSLKAPRPRHPRAATEEEKKQWQKKSGPAPGKPPLRSSRGKGGALGRG